MQIQSLIAELKQQLRGEVRFDDASRALYATDASNYRQVPIGLVIPHDIQDVLAAVAVCRKFGAPLLSRGAGTSLAGQCCNAAVIMDWSKYVNKIIQIDAGQRSALVEPGVVLDDLRHAAAAHGLTFGPDPATHNRCTLGGMIGNNSCGVHSVMSGKTADNVEALEILTYDGLRMWVGKTSDQELDEAIRAGGRRGEVYRDLKKLRDQYAALIRSRFPKLPRRVSGYNLDELLPENDFHLARALVGTEGTCVTILQAKLRLMPDPSARVLLVIGYPDVFQAADAVPEILRFKPIGLEGLDENYVGNMRKKNMHTEERAYLPQGKAWLLAEFGAFTAADAQAQAEAALRYVRKKQSAASAALYAGAAEQKAVWKIRESTFGASVFVPGMPDTFSGFEDSAVPPEKLGNYLRALQKLYDKHDYFAITYGHFGDGCIHSRISFDLRSEAGIQKYRAFMDEAADLVLSFGGSLSGEHGDGQTWGEWLPKMYGEELVGAFREFKRIWDPQNKMNPGKVIDAYRVDENLRLKTYATIPQPQTYFSFAEDSGNFARTTERCIGLGKCLKKDEDVMCPSFMATREEGHSPRGRAHLLHEMMRGEIVQDGWRSREVKDSLDLCLACKACKTECPVGVDMASYKAEFLAHYYQGRVRPLRHWLFGYIGFWTAAASRVPGIFNFLARQPFLKETAAKLLGISAQRSLPLVAAETFRAWFTRRPRPVENPASRKVVLWTDTFTNYFQPEIARAAVEFLESRGFEVIIHARQKCCGRPFYDFGMLGAARQALREILREFEPYLQQDVPVIFLEPGCASVFRDEMLNLFPQDDTALRFSRQVYLWTEFVSRFVSMEGETEKTGAWLVQPHCHEKALFKEKNGSAAFEKLGMSCGTLNAGCCGMAGAFGFEKEHADLSVKIAADRLLPAIAAAGEDKILVADGFSCREQIRHLTGKNVWHSAQIMAQFLKK